MMIDHFVENYRGWELRSNTTLGRTTYWSLKNNVRIDAPTLDDLKQRIREKQNEPETPGP